MAGNKSDKDAEWPALSDIVSVTDGRHLKNMKTKSKDNNSVNGRDSQKESSKESVNINGGTRKKKNNKIVWQPLQIETQPYRKKGIGRFSNESIKSAENDKNHHRSRYEFSNNSENGRGNFRSGGFKGKRGRAYSSYRSHLEDESNLSEASLSCGIIINGVTFFPQTFSDATRKNFLKRQMEYYFSDSNLVGDVYLRLKMNNLGFVPLNIFLNFPRIMHLTRDINVLADAVEESNKLELSYHNYQLYVRRIVDPLGWKIKNPYIDDIEIPFDDPYSAILPLSEASENTLNNEESSDEPNLTAEFASETSCNRSQDEIKSNAFSDEVSSDIVTSNDETYTASPIEAEANLAPVVHQMKSLSLNGNTSLTLHIEPVDAQYVPSFNEESSNTISPVTASPSEYDIELSGIYIDSKAVNNSCDYYAHPAFSESVEQVGGPRFYSGNVYNDVILYETNELSNQGPVYYMVNSREVLSTSSDNSNEEVLHLSPEPSR